MNGLSNTPTGVRPPEKSESALTINRWNKRKRQEKGRNTPQVRIQIASPPRPAPSRVEEKSTRQSNQRRSNYPKAVDRASGEEEMPGPVQDYSRKYVKRTDLGERKLVGGGIPY